MRRLVLPSLMVLLLAACAPPASDTPADGPTPPADAPAEPAAPAAAGPDFGKDINAVGTEPFWAVEIREATLTLKGPDREDLTTPHAGPALQGGAAVFQGAGATPLKVTLTVEACSDGMSDLTYPYAARVETTGELLSGCAAPTDAWPKQPPVQ